MKKGIYFLILLTIAACNSNENKQAGIEEEPVMPDSVVIEMPLYNPDSKLFVWKNDVDYTQTKNPELNNNILNADSLIKGLNQLNENIVLDKVKISGDTIYTEIKNSSFLTEGLGTSGAEIYLADVVMNLTEVPGIKYVNINLKEGSHMQPGTWSRNNFYKYKLKN